MLDQHILLHLGKAFVTLRGLLLLLLLAAYAGVCLYFSPKRAVKREKAAWALLCGFAGMLLLGRAAYLFLDENAVNGVLSAGELSFFGFLGFFLGIRLYCWRSPKAFRKLLRLFAPPFVPFAALTYLLRDGTAGVPAAQGGLFRYSDVYGLSRWNAPLLQGTLLLLLMAAAWTAQYLTAALARKSKDKASKIHRFRVKLLPMTLAALSLLLPMELLRDTAQRRILGAPCEALAIWLCLTSLMAWYLTRRLSDDSLPLKSKLINFILALILPLCSLFTLRGRSALLCLVFTALPVFLTLSPLFPFVKRPNRTFACRHRRFN